MSTLDSLRLGGLPRYDPLSDTAADRSAIAVHDAGRPRPLRRLPDLMPAESPSRRVVGCTIAVVVAALYLTMLLQYWAPANSGTDQNGYLVGGKSFARTLTTRQTPADDFAFIGSMYVGRDLGTPDARYYPKYPLGLPILYAICLWTGGATPGAAGYAMAHLVSPVCAALAALGVFAIARRLAGSFVAVIAMITFACGQVMLPLALNPNSHATDVCCVVWGIFLIMRWWQTGALWRGALGGFLIGFAVMVRYTEGLLVLPLAFACVCALRRNWSSLWRSAVPLVAWCVPVAYLAIFNKVAMGTWTGYDSTNESTGFTWDGLASNWENAIRQLHDAGTFFLLPLGLIGFVLLYQRSRRLATFLLLWFVPGTLLYIAYYWAPDRVGISYARFFLSFMPVVIIAAAVTLQAVSTLLERSSSRTPAFGSAAFGTSALAAITVGLIGATASAVPVYRAFISDQGATREGQNLEQVYVANLNLAGLGDMIVRDVPAGAMLIAESQRTANHLQFVSDATIYTLDAFSESTARRTASRAGADPDNPNPIDRNRVVFLTDLYRGQTDKTLEQTLRQRITDAIDARRRVFLAISERQERSAIKRFEGLGLKLRRVDVYSDIVSQEPPRSEADTPWNRLTRRTRDDRGTTRTLLFAIDAPDGAADR